MLGSRPVVAQLGRRVGAMARSARQPPAASLACARLQRKAPRRCTHGAAEAAAPSCERGAPQRALARRHPRVELRGLRLRLAARISDQPPHV